jgi:hypothetical protein
MKEHYFVEKSIDICLLLLFGQCDRVLSIEINHHITGIVAFPVNLNCQIVVSGIKVNLDSPITIAVYEITDISAELVD